MRKIITIKSPSEIEILRHANKIVAEVLEILRNRIKPGINTFLLNKWAEEGANIFGGKPAFKGYRGFPSSLCVSLNEQVVHGIPSKKVILKEGDIVSIDFGIKYKGFFGDAAITVPVGKINDQKTKLIKITEEALSKGIEQVYVGNRVNDISLAVQNYVENNGFSVVRQFVGHGIGTQLHEPPEIPNYRRQESSPRIIEGMVLAIEPMVNAGSFDVKVLKDGWTVVTKDHSPSAHFEHSVAVTSQGPIILSALTSI